jgi:hypothetical protein
MEIFISLTIILGVAFFMALMVPLLFEDKPLVLVVAAMIPVSLLHWAVSLGMVTIFFCLLIICLPFLIMERSNRSR